VWKRFINDLWLAGAAVAIVAQPAWADVTPVTDVRLNSKPSSVEVILVTPSGEPFRVLTSSYGKTFVADIVNTQLRLPNSQSFRANNPTEGIVSVTVTQKNTNSIQVTVIGQESLPTAKVTQTGKDLVFSLNAAADTITSQSTLTPEPPTTGVQSETPEVTDPDETAEEIEVVVTATRTEEAATDVPRSVTVITREQIEAQTALSRDLQDILGQTVPGLGPSTQTANIFGQTLRGRRPLVLIDGVPIRSNLSTVQARDLRSIDPSVIERIEVVRGPTAVYGNGGTGGVINIITRRPTDERLTSTTEVGVNAALGNFEADSFGNTLQHLIGINQGNFDLTFSLARVETGSFFDAAGDRIPAQDSNVADSEIFDLFGKVGVNLGEQQRLQLTANHYDNNDNSTFISDPIVDELPGIQKARALKVPEPEYIGSREPDLRNTVISLEYTHENLWGSQVQAQAYYRHNSLAFNGFDYRNLEIFNPEIGRGLFDKELWGGRLQIDTPISDAVSLLWGVDYSDEHIVQDEEIFGTEDYDKSGRRVFRKIGEGTGIPPYDLRNLGAFAQLQWNVSDRLLLSGGARYERFDLSVDDYTLTLFEDSPRSIAGGDLNFDDVVFNLGAVYKVTDSVSLFANFAQGFSAPDFGRLFRSPPIAFTSVESDLEVTQPQRVDNYEIGIRGEWSSFQASLAGFYNESELGERLQPGAVFATLVRAPQRIYGLEATLDWQPGGGWQLGSTASWIEGEEKQEDEEYLALNSATIQPLKLTAYVEHQTTPSWRNRLQLLYVGDRDRAFEDGTEDVPIEDYLILDYISSIQLGPGQLQVGIENLLNNQYFPVQSQIQSGFFEQLNYAGRGRTIRINYSLSW
jgi:iron complex outermembrane receptor protein